MIKKKLKSLHERMRVTILRKHVEALKLMVIKNVNLDGVLGC